MQQYQFIQGQARSFREWWPDIVLNSSQWQNLTRATRSEYFLVDERHQHWRLWNGQAGLWPNQSALGESRGVNTYDSLKQAYGLEELSDGSTVNGMATIGQLRRNAQQLELHIKQLEDDSLSPRPT